MLRVLGSQKQFCDGISRRDALWVGGLSMLGLHLSDQLRAEQKPVRQPDNPLPGFGKAKSCILLFLYGSPSQLELADMKPDAPLEIRGDFRPIPSALPGCDVCELLPNTAKVMDRVTVLRSVTHAHPIHGVAYATTGVPKIDVPMELNPRDSRHWPFMGSVVNYLEQQRTKQDNILNNIALPWPFSTRRTGEVHRAGPYAAFLGSKYHPHFTEFIGKANKQITKTLTTTTKTFDEPYVGIEPDCQFTLGQAATLPVDMTLDRLDQRTSLLQQMERAQAKASPTNRDHFRQGAFDLIRSTHVRDALDISREKSALRDQYGMTVFGQAALAARKLVEAGSRFVTVFWDEFGLAGSGWDTHWEHYPRMKDELMPGFDKAFSGLIADLDQRGMLDETLVLVLSEHGRTPKINKAKGGGRDHWSQAYSVMMAGGGIKRGQVIGKTDNIGGTVVDRPISPKDILATTYHLLGYDLETVLHDQASGRPYPILSEGSVLTDAIA
ncbi:MAG: DUF1501 domain-containing protein [Zavarzinella sp.]